MRIFAKSKWNHCRDCACKVKSPPEGLSCGEGENEARGSLPQAGDPTEPDTRPVTGKLEKPRYDAVQRGTERNYLSSLADPQVTRLKGNRKFSPVPACVVW